MKIIEIKGHKLGNSLTVYHNYKNFTGRNLMGDIMKLQAASGSLERTASGKATAKDMETIQSHDVVEIVTGLYYAARVAAEPQLANQPHHVIVDELSVNDLDGELVEGLVGLLVPDQKKD